MLIQTHIGLEEKNRMNDLKLILLILRGGREGTLIRHKVTNINI